MNRSGGAKISRILVADDHSAVRRGVRALLESRPDIVVVAEASTGREALEAAVESVPDIAILDHRMPELDGREVMIRLRDLLPSAQVIIYTMQESEELWRDCVEAGAAAVVLKSGPVEHLVDAIDALRVNKRYLPPFVARQIIVHNRRGKVKSSILTRRENQVLQLMAEGMTNKHIAQALGISLKTVESHRGTMMDKLGLRTTAEAVRYALRNGIAEA